MAITFPESLEKIVAEVVEKVFNEALERIEKKYQALYTIFIEAFLSGNIMENIKEAKINGELSVIERYLGMDPINMFNLPVYREALNKYICEKDLFVELANNCEMFDPYDINLQTEENRRIMIEEIFCCIGNEVMDRIRFYLASKNRTRIIKNSRTVLYWAGQ